MQFKITITSVIFFLLIGSLSIANPIAQNEKPTQKTEQITKKKKRFPLIASIRQMMWQIRNTKGQKASAWSITSLSLGVAAFPLYATAVWGFVASGLGVVVGIIGLVRAKNLRSELLSEYGIKLGAGLILFVLLFALMVRSLAYAQ